MDTNKITKLREKELLKMERKKIKPIVKICERAYLKMYYYTLLEEKEIGGLLKISQYDNCWVIEDAIILKQKVNSVHFSIYNDALIKFSSEIKREDMKKWKGWWHSHSNMNASWSSEDYDTFSHLNGVMGDMIGIVLNKRREFTLMIIKDNKQFEVDFTIIPNNLDLSGLKKEIKEKVVKENIVETIIGNTTNARSLWGTGVIDAINNKVDNIKRNNGKRI